MAYDCGQHLKVFRNEERTLFGHLLCLSKLLINLEGERKKSGGSKTTPLEHSPKPILKTVRCAKKCRSSWIPTLGAREALSPERLDPKKHLQTLSSKPP